MLGGELTDRVSLPGLHRSPRQAMERDRALAYWQRHGDLPACDCGCGIQCMGCYTAQQRMMWRHRICSRRVSPSHAHSLLEVY